MTFVEPEKPTDLKGELATIPELHEFIDKVRAVLGESPLTELMPSIPHNANQCLLAKNFGGGDAIGVVHAEEIETQNVYGEYSYDWPQWPSGARKWAISVTDLKQAAELVDVLGLERESERTVILPERIGNIAEAFDAWDKNPQLWPKFDEYVDSAYRSKILGEIGAEPVEEYDPS